MRVIFGCESARKGSYQAIRTFPRGYASYSQTEVNTLLSRQKSSYSIRSGPRVIHNEHCFQSATDFLIYTQIAILFSMHTGRTHEDYFTVFGANSARIASKIRVSSALSAGRIRLRILPVQMTTCVDLDGTNLQLGFHHRGQKKFQLDSYKLGQLNHCELFSHIRQIILQDS